MSIAEQLANLIKAVDNLDERIYLYPLERPVLQAHIRSVKDELNDLILALVEQGHRDNERMRSILERGGYDG